MNGAKVVRKNPDALNRLADRLKKLAGKEIAVGFPAGKAQAYPDGTPVVEVAAAHVFGIGVKERDFMTLGKEMMKPKVKPVLRKIAKLAVKVDGNSTDAQAVQNLQESAGQLGQTAIREVIVDGDWAPNSDSPMSEGLREEISKSWGVDIPEGMSYLEAKRKFLGSDKPLIAMGHMVASVTYVVRDKSS